MNPEFLLLIAVVVAGFSGLYWFLVRHRGATRSEDKGLNNMFLMMQNQINEITRTLDTRMSESSSMFQQQFGLMQNAFHNQANSSTKIIQEVTEHLAKLGETNKQVVNFADQLRSLQDILKNPKQRGILGEYYLETVLKNVLPPGSYEMQYKLAEDLIPDAVIFVKDKIIPVDSKFSLENYNRIVESRDEGERERLEKQFRNDLKSRIDETSKYVRPDLGTMDFAFMFIPAEAIYYDLLVNQVGTVKVNTQDLIQYAFKDRKVIIVSPTSFLAYLQTVLQGLRGLQIEESAKEIRKNVEELRKHLQSYDSYFKKLGGHLGTTVNMYNAAYKEFGKIDKDVYRISGERVGVEVGAIEGPKSED